MNEERPKMYADSYTPQPGDSAPPGDNAWRDAILNVLNNGQEVSPRGMKTKEILHAGLVSIDMASAVVTSPRRKLNYRFMAAEALWILRGDDLVEPLAKHVERMRTFSDDGVHLAGAYGPRIVPQLPYVVDCLVRDRDTRQAVLTIWDRCPKPSKDIPCTVSMVFSVRKGRLYQHVFMRSSDAWLGLPYDMFSFSCVGLKVACEYNRTAHEPILPGTLTISATSSHIYERDMANVMEVLASDSGKPVESVPDELVLEGDWARLQQDLTKVEGGEPHGLCWEVRP